MSCLHFVPIPLILLYHNRSVPTIQTVPRRLYPFPLWHQFPVRLHSRHDSRESACTNGNTVCPPVIERPKAANAAAIAKRIASTGKIRIYQEHVYWYENGWYHLLQTGELRRLMRSLCADDSKNTAASGFSRTSKSSCSAIPSCLLNHQATIRCSASRTVSMIWYRTPYHHILLPAFSRIV